MIVMDNTKDKIPLGDLTEFEMSVHSRATTHYNVSHGVISDNKDTKKISFEKFWEDYFSGERLHDLMPSASGWY